MKIGYRLTWKNIKGDYLHKDKRLTGTIDIWDVSEEDAIKQFLVNNNVFGRKFKVISVTEIDGTKPKKGKHNTNDEHGQFDKQPKWDDIPG